MQSITKSDPAGKISPRKELSGIEEMMDEEEDDEKILPSNIDPSFLWKFVLIQFMVNLFINIDNGILPAGAIIITKDLNLKTDEFGGLGSFVYFGQTIGSAMATGVLQSCNPKYVLVLCLTLNVGTLILFCSTTNYWVLVTCRTLTGLFQVYFCIFLPVWADVFGN